VAFFPRDGLFEQFVAKGWNTRTMASAARRKDQHPAFNALCRDAAEVGTALLVQNG
jgi:hypothetical protein